MFYINDMKVIIRMILGLFGVTCSILILFSCGGSGQHKANRVLEEWIGRQVVIPNDLVYTKYGTDTVEYSQAYTDYKILVYVDTVGCTSCQLQLERWLDWVDCLKNKSSYSVSYLFDFYPKDTEELVDLLRFYDFSVPVCIDETDRLNQLNKFPAGGKFHTFLLDRDNKVVLVGSPVNNENIAELYRDILLAPDTVPMMRTDVEISQREVNFPKIAKDSIQYSFPLKNVGNKKLLINAVNVSCGCTSVEYTKQPINPGDSGLVKVFVKKEKEGYLNETITVYCNASDSPLVLKLYGNAI